MLSKFINEEPALESDRTILGMLQPLRIEKGEPFNPDARRKKILIEAAQVGELMARTILFEKRFPGATVLPGKKWEISLCIKKASQEAPHYTQLDERTSWFYEAVGVSEGMMGRTVGFGQVYLESSKDAAGSRRFPARATSRSCGCTAPRKRRSTRPGSPATSS